jgi:hypothetical protein
VLAKSLELSLLSPYPVWTPPLDGLVDGVVASAVLFLALAALLVRQTACGWRKGS